LLKFTIFTNFKAGSHKFSFSGLTTLFWELLPVRLDPQRRSLEIISECFFNKTHTIPITRVLKKCKVVVWLSGNSVAHSNKVTLRQAALVLRWVTGIPSGHLNQLPRPTQPGHPSMGRHSK